MTINKYLQQLSPEDLAYVKQYHHEIQPFRVLPSSTLEFDGQFNGDGERKLSGQRRDREFLWLTQK